MSNSWTIIDPSSALDLESEVAGPPIHPGEMLRDHFMAEMQLTGADVARAMGVGVERVEAILAGAALTGEDSVRLAHAFQMSDGFWMRLQTRFDVEIARNALGQSLAALPVLVAA